MNFFLISLRKHVVSTHQKCLGEALLMSTYMFSWRNKKNINTFGLKKVPYHELEFIHGETFCEKSECLFIRKKKLVMQNAAYYVLYFSYLTLLVTYHH